MRKLFIMGNDKISKEVGKFLVIRLDEGLCNHIAEVIQTEPLIVKVTESGVLARLKESSHFIVLEKETKLAQGTDEENQELLTEAVKKGKPLLSGLKSLGIEDGQVHEILPYVEN